MIPYFPQLVWHVGRFEIHAFGIAAALALNVGFFLVMWRARRTNLDRDLAAGLFLATAVAGTLAGHLLFVIQNRGSLLRVWQGQSSAGVALGVGIVATAIYFLLPDHWLYLDALAFAFPFVWMLVRAGCAMAHDHPGRSTNSLLGVRFPAGTRYDLGLLEFLLAAVLCLIFLALARAGWRQFLALAMIATGFIRLALIPLRLPDANATPVDMITFSAACLAGLAVLWLRQGTLGSSTKAR
ncbi:MAG TPA: prolipoprotein diacylglyceryl transferase family protein [Bryobacteraceae bacterium]|nr:prolipoprotein diacylglyceryl transferase family protein [Bryobacteraceae bacterium]